ncbi:MAG: hypothetical protein KDB02_09040 [Acidimicrobiales bacterium]|nr:hypothetical protein [Acidimicrobiales bacterium]
MTEPHQVAATSPGRVNLIGDHTDVADGLVLPMAIDLATTVTGTRGGQFVEVTSADEPDIVRIDIDAADPLAASSGWGRYVAAVVAEVRPSTGFRGTVGTTLPVGAGLSSSAALEVSVALALGFDGTPLELAELCRRAEHRASGVPCGIMDQLAVSAGVAGHALLIDCATRSIEPVPVPNGVEIRVIHSGQKRRLAESGYATRTAEVREAEERIGPLREIADPAAVADLEEPLRRRARHVITENARVIEFAAALRRGDLAVAGEAMKASHRSLRDDYEVSTDVLDSLVERLNGTPGVHGARLTGAGFGGCVVALAEPGALTEGWLVRPSSGASVSR